MKVFGSRTLLFLSLWAFSACTSGGHSGASAAADQDKSAKASSGSVSSAGGSPLAPVPVPAQESRDHAVSANTDDSEAVMGERDVLKIQIHQPEVISQVDFESDGSEQKILIDGAAVVATHDAYSKNVSCQVLLGPIEKDEVLEMIVLTESGSAINLQETTGGSFVTCTNIDPANSPAVAAKWTLAELQKVFGATATITLEQRH